MNRVDATSPVGEKAKPRYPALLETGREAAAREQRGSGGQS